MPILALDQAKKCGWAVAVPPYRIAPTALEVTSGMKRAPAHMFGVKVFESESRQYGWLAIQFARWLERDILEPFDIDSIVFESPIGKHRSLASARIAIALATVIDMVATKHKIPCSETTNNVVKKYATGNGNANKAMMVDAARAVGWNVGEDDNAADALWILDHKISTMRRAAA